jgi:hypothetical protein
MSRNLKQVFQEALRKFDYLFRKYYLAKLKIYYWKNFKYSKTPMRYKQLIDIVQRKKPKSIMEIGVYTGQRALEMIEAASACCDREEITYYGFDLFEMIDLSIVSSELSKKPLTEEAIKKKLYKSGAKFFLYKGFSNNTLPIFIAKNDLVIDFVFVDGGHAIETIHSDWLNIKQVMSDHTIVIFDDYYVSSPLYSEKFGCNNLIENLDQNEYNYEILPIVDRFNKPEGEFNVAMVKVWRK